MESTWSGAFIHSLRLNGAELCDSVSYQVCDDVQEAHVFYPGPGRISLIPKTKIDLPSENGTSNPRGYHG